MAKNKYTREMNDLILSGDVPLRELAERWGIRLDTLQHRRTALRNAQVSGNDGSRFHRDHLRRSPPPPPSPFARPDWFDEDLSQMTRGAVR